VTTQLVKAVEEMLDKGRPGGDDAGRETVDNRERGCGHLKPNSAYVRTDVAALSSPDGEIPPWVTLDDPIEYRENPGKGAIIPGYNAFPGNSFSLHYVANGGTTTPEGDIDDHIDRLRRWGFDGDHYGDITSAKAIDILMSVGKSNWETPEEFIEESRDRGLNLKIPVSSRQEPPIVEPLRTRCWVIHPHGCGENRPGIIGYAYLTRVIYTSGTKATDEDPDIPKWAENFAKTGRLDVVDRGEPIAEDEDVPETTLENFAPEAEEDDEPEPVERDRDVATVTIPSGANNRDVTGLEIEFGRDDIDADERVESFENALEGPLTYNALKVIASNRDDVDVGSHPSTDDIVEALADVGAIVPAYWRANAGGE